MSEEKKYHFETLQLHVGQEQADPATDSRAVPIYQTTSYVFRNSQHAADRFALKDAGNVYGRLTNPTEDVFEKRIAALEGGVAALATASGAAAVTYAMQALVHAGQHIVCATTVYGGTYNLFEHTFPDFGIETTFVDPTKGVHVFEEAVRENTQAIYIESVGNPNANLIDIDAVAAIAHKHKIPLVVDSTFATPYLLRPFEHGADVVVHSATKFIGGHGTTLGGIIVDSGKFDWVASGRFPWLVDPNPSYHGISFAKDVGPAAYVTYIRTLILRDTGATLSPFNAFLQLILESGHASFALCQNVYCSTDVRHQGLSVALAISQTLLEGQGGAWRMQGGGFAGTIQAFVPGMLTAKYHDAIEKVFGAGSCYLLRLREQGALRVI